jgi:hypothetical protein
VNFWKKEGTKIENRKFKKNLNELKIKLGIFRETKNIFNTELE